MITVLWEEVVTAEKNIGFGEQIYYHFTTQRQQFPSGVTEA
jgi:hypothetical protein